MRICSTCGHEVAPGDDFCTTCGARQAMTPPDGPEPEPRPVTAAVFAGPPAPPPTGPPPPSDGPPPPPSPRPGSGADGGKARRAPDLVAMAAPGAASATDELLGQAAPNATYLGQRMLYEKDTQTLESLDPLGNARYRRELVFHIFLTVFIWWLGAIGVSVLAGLAGLINPLFGVTVLILLGIAWCITMACVFWLRKLPAQLSEWKFSVDDRGDAAPVALDHVAWTFTRRNTPVDVCRVRRFAVMGQGSRDVLEVRQGTFYGLVSCFASGNDLYIGWTFWLYLSPARWLLIWLRRLLWEIRFRGHAIYVSLQFDRAKALREALHSASREGVDVAAGQVAAQGQGTVGSLVPVVTDDSTRDPAWQWAGVGGY